jgi:hypothetical protein
MKLDFSSIRRNDTLGAIGALVMSSVRGSVSEVVTLNFDDILERYLCYHGIVALPVYEEKFWANRCDVTVYHAHGFLPSPGSQFTARSTFLLADRKAYDERSSHAEDRIYAKVATIMQSHVCLFVGLSGDDGRLNTLISESKQRHAYNPGGIGYWGVAVSSSRDAALVRRWRDQGVYLQTVAEYLIDLPKFLFEICQGAAAQRFHGH